MIIDDSEIKILYISGHMNPVMKDIYLMYCGKQPSYGGTSVYSTQRTKVELFLSKHHISGGRFWTEKLMKGK